MAVSGQVSSISIDAAKVIELALRRCRVPPQRISGEMTEVALDQLGLLLSDYALHGLKLWTTEKVVLGLNEGYSYVTAPPGTLEVKDVNIRSTAALDGAITATTSTCQLALTSASAVQHVGVKLSAAGAFDFVIERSSNGSSWVTAANPAAAAYAADTWYWFDIEGAVTAGWIRIREANGATISVANLTAATRGREIPLGMLSRNQYASLPDKYQPGIPNQFWLDRQRDTTILYLWPCPNSSAATDRQIVGYRERHVMDVTSLTQTLDVPQNWYSAVIDGLALKLCKSVQEVDLALKPDIERDAATALAMAKMDQRSRADIVVDVDIRRYTRAR